MTSGFRFPFMWWKLLAGACVAGLLASAVRYSPAWPWTRGHLSQAWFAVSGARFVRDGTIMVLLYVTMCLLLALACWLWLLFRPRRG